MDSGIRNMFSGIARRYDLLNRLMTAGLDRRWRRRAVSLLPNLENACILDLCAGTGDFAIQCLRMHDECSIVLGDFSPEILRVAQKKLAKGRCMERASITAADALRLPFADDTFDAVICGFGLRNIEPPVDALIQMKRVLREGGTFVILELFRPDTRPAKLFHYAFVTPVIPILGAVFAWNLRAYAYLVRSIRENLTLEEVCMLAEVVGFRKVEGIRIGKGTVSILTGVK